MPGASSVAALSLRVHRFRVLGMGLAGIPIAVVLHENGAAAWTFGLWLFTSLIWPHLALFLSRRSRHPYRAELLNLLLDSAIAGFWVPLMHFNLLPSVLILTLATVDKISTGIAGLWLRSIPGVVVAVLCGGLLTGFAFQPESSTPVVLASLPLLLIHTIAVALTSNLLVQKVREKNRRLDELSRTDVLTGVFTRGHWQQLALQQVQQRHSVGSHAALLMIDVDLFKSVNDSHGHPAGDEVLRQVARIIRAQAGDSALVGRYGGDEFAVILPDVRETEARVTADGVVAAVRNLSLPQAPGLRCSVSIGVAGLDGHGETFSSWLEAADAALYLAKAAGRGRVGTHAPGNNVSAAPLRPHQTLTS